MGSLHARHIAVALISITALAGCAAYNKWPAFDESRSRFVLVAGYFSGVRQLDERPCMLSDEEVESGVVDCWSGTPSVTTLNAFDVVYGTLPRSRVQVAYSPSLQNSDRPPGDGKPMLVLLLSDGNHFVLTSQRASIVQTTQGDWAMPVYENETLTVLPCGAEPLVKPLRFAPPLPGDTLENIGEFGVERLQGNTRVRISDGRFTITHGVLLNDMRKFMATAHIDPDQYYCHEYEHPESTPQG